MRGFLGGNDLRHALLARDVRRQRRRDVDDLRLLPVSRGAGFVVLQQQGAARIGAAIDGDLLLRQCCVREAEQRERQDDGDGAFHANAA